MFVLIVACFLNLISQGSVVMHLRCGWIFSDYFITCLILSQMVKKMKIYQHLAKLSMARVGCPVFWLAVYVQYLCKQVNTVPLNKLCGIVTGLHPSISAWWWLGAFIYPRLSGIQVHRVNNNNNNSSRNNNNNNNISNSNKTVIVVVIILLVTTTTIANNLQNLEKRWWWLWWWWW